MKEARLYSREKDGIVSCALCRRRCRIKPGKRGYCGVRKNQQGVLTSLVYGRVAAEHIDPVEKKPFYHFLPASRSFSISTVGCNFSCQHCQNYQISQYPYMHQEEIIGSRRSPEQIVTAAEQAGCRSISYTYAEPTVFYEFAHDCMVSARARGLANLFVSNGFMTAECSRELAPFLDGINIDIKSFSEEFYRTVCKASLQPVLDTVRLMRELAVWVEVTTLLIPGLNDSAQELAAIASFIADLDPAIPWHVTAFHPTYKMLDRQPTPSSSLRMARKIGFDTGLRFIYQGNICSGEGENTLCPSCHTELITRTGFLVRSNRIQKDRCPECGERIEGVWRFSEYNVGGRQE